MLGGLSMVACPCVGSNLGVTCCRTATVGFGIRPLTANGLFGQRLTVGGVAVVAP